MLYVRNYTIFNLMCNQNLYGNTSKTQIDLTSVLAWWKILQLWSLQIDWIVLFSDTKRLLLSSSSKIVRDYLSYVSLIQMLKTVGKNSKNIIQKCMVFIMDGYLIVFKLL
ncbi:hypothetical protein RFI_09388 [Reticulomyxa filosa]|uniref:Uncharacterized protein n=1 Tax=Reticulomyxa filosa TaxID=46433 RepID=X6NN86_RETFI|nr:hypothetical protein RFI_09388 [Reticulomyxa filosa]|eukprot:ETO27745.1 hypothetical protein RFI_09388 [Reticulomyxa filosa]